jgi:Leucine-rich repeat (LRR) protein
MMYARLLSILLTLIFLAGCEHHPSAIGPYYGGYTTLESALENASSAKELRLSAIGDSLSPEIGRLQKLWHLEIRDSPIRFLPEAISLLNSLTHLELINTQLESFPPQIWRNRKIFNLYIDSCGISFIPDSLESSSITWLALHDCNIDSIPAWMMHWEQLHTLGLSSNNIKNFNVDEFSYKDLSQLSLQYNQLRAFETASNSFKSLYSLDLGNNELEEFNVASGSLSELKYLSLHYNNLTDFRVTASALPKLVHLGLVGNPIPPSSRDRIRLSFPNAVVYF